MIPHPDFGSGTRRVVLQPPKPPSPAAKRKALVAARSQTSGARK